MGKEVETTNPDLHREAYRNEEEARRLRLENDARELALLEKQIKIAKQNGATEEELKPLRNRILGRPIWTPNPENPLPPKETLLLPGAEEHPIDTLPTETRSA
jgi:hypothetical protein